MFKWLVIAVSVVTVSCSSLKDHVEGGSVAIRLVDTADGATVEYSMRGMSDSTIHLLTFRQHGSQVVRQIGPKGMLSAQHLVPISSRIVCFVCIDSVHSAVEVFSWNGDVIQGEEAERIRTSFGEWLRLTYPELLDKTLISDGQTLERRMCRHRGSLKDVYFSMGDNSGRQFVFYSNRVAVGR